MDYILLAQGVEAVEQGLTWLERIQAGGIPLLSLVIATLCGIAFYWQLKENKHIRKAQVDQAEQREEKVKAEALSRMVDQEKLLREMLERDREAQEAHIAATQAVEGFTAALRDCTRQLEEVVRNQRVLSDRLEELARDIRRTS